MKNTGKQELMSSLPPIAQIGAAIRQHIGVDKIAATINEALNAESSRFNRETGLVVSADYDTRLKAAKLAAELGYGTDADVQVERELSDFMRVIVSGAKKS